MSTVNIVVDTARCVGSGTCMAIAPNLFEFDDEDRSHPVAAVVEESDDIRTAIDMCPTAAIALRQVPDSSSR